MTCSCSGKSQKTPCCPPFNPELWKDKEVTWNNKLFLKDHVISFLHMPLTVGKMFAKNMPLIDAVKALPENPIWLADENSLWGADYYIEVTKDIPNSKMVNISGTFLTKVFEGPYRNACKWAKEMERYVASKGKTAKKIYFFYTTCPKCAKIYGKNYVVLFAQV